MKKLYRQITVLFFLLMTTNSFCFGQIYVISGQNQSMTITPQGIQGKLPASTEVTNVALGRGALSSATQGAQNTAVGDKALFSNKGSQNSALGSYALFDNTLGYSNSALGNNALESNTIGYENAAIGAYALNKNTSNSKNVAVGYYALGNQSYNNSTSAENTAIGHFALYSNNPTSSTNGRQNTAIGSAALYFNQTGSNNIAVGAQAMYSHTQNDDNVAIGYRALFSNTIGAKNVAVGNEALANTTGSGNVAIGYRAGYNSSASDALYIANDETPTPLIGGDFAAGKLAINRNLTILGVNEFRSRTEALQVGGEAFKTLGSGNWQFSSDQRLKKNIESLSSREMLQKLLQMQGVTYKMKDDSQPGMLYGFIAQDLREIFPTKIKENANGYLSADYGSYDPILIEAIKALNGNVEELYKNNPSNELKYQQLALTINNLSTRVNQLEETHTIKSEEGKAEKK